MPKKVSRAAKEKAAEQAVKETAEQATEAVAEKKQFKILYLASECQPFCATGGLGDVMGSLPKAVKATHPDADVRVMLPLYGDIKQEYRERMNFLGYTYVDLAWRRQYCGVMELVADGVTYYFLDNEYYFKREGQYGYFDDGERYAFFSKAALSVLPLIGYIPTIIHCNDWQTALVPVYLKTLFRDEYFVNIRTVFTIHNIAYQGKYDPAILGDVFGLGEQSLSILSYDGCLNLMKGAIVCCDILSTVSPTYAEEIKTPEYSYGLHYIIKQNAYKLKGIINGIDTAFYNPATDDALFAKYDKNSPDGKTCNKVQLQQMLNLPVDENVPLVSRASITMARCWNVAMQKIAIVAVIYFNTTFFFASAVLLTFSFLTFFLQFKLTIIFCFSARSGSPLTFRRPRIRRIRLSRFRHWTALRHPTLSIPLRLNSSLTVHRKARISRT